MLPRRVLLRVDNPVPVDLLGERVERAEQRIRHRHRPHRALDRLPPRHPLRALDHDVLAGRGLVRDAPLIAQPTAPRPHPLAVHPLVHDDGVSRLRQFRRTVDRPQGPVRRSVARSPNRSSRRGTTDAMPANLPVGRPQRPGPNSSFRRNAGPCGTAPVGSRLRYRVSLIRLDPRSRAHAVTGTALARSSFHGTGSACICRGSLSGRTKTTLLFLNRNCSAFCDG